MKPLKFLDVVVETAKVTGLSEEAVDNVLRLYFKEVRSALSSLEHHRVRVCNLGTFCAKPKAVAQRLEKRERLLRKLCGLPGLRNEAMYADVLLEVEQMQGVLDGIEREGERRRQVKDF
jgi:nucleoid DNA-binding protein